MTAVEKLARVLDGVAFYDTAWHSTIGAIGAIYVRTTRQEAALRKAERILADPGPLLEALAEAGVLTRVTDLLPPRSDGMHPRGRGGVHWAAERYVSEWRADSKWRPTDA